MNTSLDLKNWRTEIVAGVTTFLTMAYIIFVNPGILSGSAGMDRQGVIAATCLAAAEVSYAYLREHPEDVEADLVGEVAADPVVVVPADEGDGRSGLDEATERMRASEKAAARIPENELTPIIRNLDRYLLERVDIARARR